MLLLLLLAILPLYLTFRSISLDDFDSYSFAMALTDFNIVRQQPQPPGFPIYVATGRVFLALLATPVQALTALSALSGAVAVLLVYGIGRTLDPDQPRVGLLAALCFALAPMSWLTADKALSDMPGLMWTLLSVALWLRRHHDGESAPTITVSIACGLITGLALGVRPQNALPILVLTGELLLVDLARATRSPRHSPVRRSLTAAWLISGATGVAGILIWLIPTAITTGGLGPYLQTIAAHAAHVGRADALLSLDMPLSTALRTRAIASLDTLLTGLTGTDPYSRPLEARYAIVTLFAVVVPALIAAEWRRPAIRRVGLWMAAVVGQIFFFETLDRPRLFLPLLPWLALLIASGIARIRKPRMLRTTTTVLVPLLLLIRTLPLAAELSRTPSPPAQATAYIAQRYPPEETVLAAAGSFRAAQVELPGYPLLYLYQFDAQAAVAAAEKGIRYIAILDRDQFPSDVVASVIDALSQPEVFPRSAAPGDTWITLEDRTFARDRRVHTQHDQVRVQVLTPAALVPPAMLSLPPGGCIDIGAQDDAAGRYLGDGWFRSEEISGARARWAGGTLTTTVRVHLPTLADGVVGSQTLRLRALAYPPSQALSIEVNGVVTSPTPLPQEWHEIAFTLPAAAFTDAQITTLTLIHRAAASPFDTLSGTSSDTRSLTAAYDWLCIGPEAAEAGD